MLLKNLLTFFLPWNTRDVMQNDPAALFYTTKTNRQCFAKCTHCMSQSLTTDVHWGSLKSNLELDVASLNMDKHE